jgi:branched-chain amino acid transport system permease protein
VCSSDLAEFGHILGYQWTDLTRGEDGLSFKLPGVLDVGFSAGTFLGVEISGRLLTYYLILIVATLLFVGLVRFVNSPVGRVLQAVRDNEPRATALGYQTFHYKVLAAVFGHTVAALAGVLFAMWLRFVNPDSVLGTGLMLSILLMVIIGGLGTTYGAIVGAAFIKLTETWLPDLQAGAKALAPGAELLHRLAERWILYFGVLFILVVFFFPRGIIGTIRERARRRAAAAERPKD